MSESDYTVLEARIASIERQIKALREIIFRLRQSSLMDVDTFERALETSPRTAELRKQTRTY